MATGGPVTGSGHRGVAGAVLAGGASRRMGVDKAFLEVDGRPLAVGALAALHDADVSPVLIVGGDPGLSAVTGHEVVPDSWPGSGPLGGILTALSALDEDGRRPVVVLACDLPDASPTVISELLDRGADAQGSVVVPMLEGVPQWLHALWPAGARATLAEAFEAGERAPRRAARILPVIEVVVFDERSLRDVDRPEDLRDRKTTDHGPAGCPD